MTTIQFAIAIYAAGAGLAFSTWCVWSFATKTLPPRADWTTWLVYRFGECLIWLAAILTAGAVFGVAARAAWTLVPS